MLKTRYTHAQDMPHAEHVESWHVDMWNYGEASWSWSGGVCCVVSLLRRHAVLHLSRSRVSKRSESHWCWRTNLLSLSSYRVSSHCWALNRLLYLYILSLACRRRLASEESAIMSTSIQKRDTCWRVRKLCVKPVYFSRKPVTDRHTNTSSDLDPTSARCTCTIMCLTLRRSAIKLQKVIRAIGEIGQSSS